MTTTLEKEDNHICGNCYLYSHSLGVCLLTGDEVAFDHTCNKWFDGAKIIKTETKSGTTEINKRK